MRLGTLDRGHPRKNRVLLGIMAAAGGDEPDDVVKTMLYRPRFFGRAWAALVRSAMRGPSPWTPAEREVLGAYVSRKNVTPFCHAIHTRTASIGLRRRVDGAVLGDPAKNGLDPRLVATFAFLDRAVNGDATAEDVRTLRAAGVTYAETLDAVEVCFVFNLVNRLANSLGFSNDGPDAAWRSARALHRMGYKVPRFALR
jgi:alkylhydroperoxidase family enzyme